MPSIGVAHMSTLKTGIIFISFHKVSKCLLVVKIIMRKEVSMQEG